MSQIFNPNPFPLWKQWGMASPTSYHTTPLAVIERCQLSYTICSASHF